MKAFFHIGKRVLLSLIFSVSGFLFTSFVDPGILESILKKMQRYHTAHSQQKLYLHLDKPFYAAGDNIWFKAYLMEASLHTPDSQSRAIYVELLDNTKQIFIRKMLFASDGISFGDFTLPDTLAEGLYRIRAYTNYMKNVGEDFFFYKDFSVLNPLRKAVRDSTAAFSRDSISLTFFPEGGNLVACGFNRVAFQALGPDGKSFAAEGVIVDENNTVITPFKSQHAGMGSFKISPVSGKKYFARITKPYSLAKNYPLTAVREKGYILQVDPVGENIRVVVLSNEIPVTGEQAVINLVVQSRGKAYHALQGTLKGNAFLTNIPKSKFPDGISQITVFDSQGSPVAERLVHQENHETIRLTVETDTSAYGKRKMVIAYIDSQYRNGAPATGNFSISVYNDSLIQNVDEYPVTITNYLSLTSDLKGYVENPGYYFKDSQAETKRNLDLLMMVHGWRRFTWNDILTDTLQPVVYRHEQGIPLSGKVLKSGGKRPPAGSILKVLTMDGRAIRLSPDSAGRFYTDSLLFYDSMTLVFQTENLKGKKQPYKFSLAPVSLPPLSSQPFTSFAPFDATAFLEQRSEEKVIENSGNVKVFDEVKVTAKREVDPRIMNPYGSGGRIVEAKNLNDGHGYQSILQMVQARIPGLVITILGTQVFTTIRGKPNDLQYVVNGVITPVDAVMQISPTDVEFIEMLFNSVRFGGNALNIVLRNGASIPSSEPVGVSQVKMNGFYQAREFYSPNYDVKDARHSLKDKRTTLYWEPMIITDENGQAGVAFFTGDVPSRYRVVIEGITNDGYPGTATTVFEVK